MKQHGQRGTMLLEVMAALGVGMFLLVCLADLINMSLDDARGEQAAYQQAQVADAARRYIAANRAALLVETASGARGVSVADLIHHGMLPAGFSELNDYGQSTCVVVRQTGAGKLDAVVATYGGQAIPEKDLPFIALSAGQGSGYVSRAEPDIARGAAWQLAMSSFPLASCSGAAVTPAGGVEGGYLVSNLLSEGLGELTADFLYRDADPERPEKNQMNTPLRLGGSALARANDPCGAEPALGIDSSNGSLLVCHDSRWRTNSTSWRPPARNYAEAVADGGKEGDVRLVLDTNRAFTYRDWGTWSGLAVDQNGNLRVPGEAHAQTVSADGHIQSYEAVRGRNFHVETNVRAARDILVSRSYTAKKNIETPRMESGSYAAIAVHAAGQTCGTYPTGTVARDDKGLPLICGTGRVFTYPSGRLEP